MSTRVYLGRPNSGPTRLWMVLGDRLALAILVAMLLMAFAAWGLAGTDIIRSMAWCGAAIIGAWGIVSWAAGRWERSGLGPVRAFAALLAVAILVVGLQLVPLPSSLVTTLSPHWAETAERMRAAGVTLPTTLTLSPSPDKGIHSWNQLVACLLLFLGLATIAIRKRGAVALIGLAIAVSLGEGVYGLMVYVFKNPERSYGALYNPNHHAALVAMGLPLAIAAIHLLHRNHPRYTESILGGKNPLAVAVVLLMAAVMGWLTSLSRSSFLFTATVFAGWGGVEWYLARTRTMRSGRRRHAAAEEDSEGLPIARWAIGGALALGFVLLMGGGAVWEGVRQRNVADAEDPPGSRIEHVRSTLEGWATSPLLGTGIGSTERMMNRYARRSTATVGVNTHNDWVQWLAELGLLGMGACAAAAAWLLVRLGRESAARRGASAQRGMLGRAALAGLAIALLHAGTDFHLRLPLVSIQFLLLASVALGPGTWRLMRRLEPRSSSGRRRSSSRFAHLQAPEEQEEDSDDLDSSREPREDDAEDERDEEPIPRPGT